MYAENRTQCASPEVCFLLFIILVFPVIPPQFLARAYTAFEAGSAASASFSGCSASFQIGLSIGT
ncbi:hypothetical protein PBOR_14820 [Paenibacillus borealis]|uniref:Uncharacterized protein n=1 Tax=Paenibacillus borealis TaxID=160799 RepID=A0A089LD91_PAEBO|nr:hypothetical protein PBOR_14820 [Paenibacillus borealis]